MSPFSDITNVNLAGALTVKELSKAEKDGKAKGARLLDPAGPAVADGLVHRNDIRSAQASLIAKLKLLNQAINVIFSLEGENSALKSMLNMIKSIVKQSSRHLVDGEMNTAKLSMKELVKDLMKGINAPVKEGQEGFSEEQKVLAYIGNGFSIDILEGNIIFNIDKFLEELCQEEKNEKRRAEKAEEYKKAMGLVKGSLEQLRESVSDGLEKTGGLADAIEDFNGVDNLKMDVIRQIRQESSMASSTYKNIVPESVMKLLN